MYAGAHGIANDLDTVLKAAQILQNTFLAKKIRICLIGSGPEKSRLKEVAQSQHITIVEFMDAVCKNEIYSVLSEADVFLMLLKDSPLFRLGISPNKLFDYLVMGRPVIFGVDTPYNPIEQYQAGVTIKPSDPEALAKAIHHLSLLPKEELNEMGLRGKEFVLQHHHIQSLTDLLEKLAFDVAGKRR
jgi:glycosyltransferase involved in cell wall biosynthesis